jgi:outer membrane protein assembly factor BamB
MTSERSLRLWPGVALAIIQLLVMFLGPVLAPEAPLPVGMIGGMAGALLILLWWLFASRARWFERVGVIALIVAAVFATRAVAHESMVGAGQGMLIYFLPIPYYSLALVTAAVVASYVQGAARLAAFALAVLLVATPFALIRTPGVGAGPNFHWRWTPTPEEVLLAQVNDEPKPIAIPAPVPAVPAEPVAAKPEAAPAPAPVAPAPVPAPAKPEATVPAIPDTPAEWPGFRGPKRDGAVHGVRINTDWSASPPVQIWRRPVGPGWSSFAIHGDYFFTQEQRGDDEVVSAHRVSTGEPVWRHRDPVRFYESNGGAGPRSTPTISRGRVYTSGATGILNALDERTGALLWSHNVAAEAKVETPTWGFTASPLVIDDLVIAAASGAMAAYDRVTGKEVWRHKSRGGSYSSPHFTTIDGVPQIVLLATPGAVSVAPADGTLLWEHAWDGGVIVQPAVLDDGNIMVSAMSMTGGLGTRRLAVSRGASGWTVEERWTSNGLKPYFNDYVLHKGHAYGFDNNILASIDLQDGKRKWKGGRYGNGQAVLLADQDLLLVISEEGELALVNATPDKYTEVARFPVFDAKTWNHPVVHGDVLLVRNGEEMAAYRLPRARAIQSER